jgi:hypothetical protein
MPRQAPKSVLKEDVRKVWELSSEGREIRCDCVGVGLDSELVFTVKVHSGAEVALK